MKRSLKKIIILLIVVLSVFACKSNKPEEKKIEKAKEEVAKKLPEGLTPEQAAKVVAKVGDRKITVGDVTEQINRLSPYIRRRWAAPEKRKEFLQKLIRVELLSQEAEAQGLDKDPEVQRTVKQVMIRLMVKNDLEGTVLPTTADEKLLREEYDKDYDKYHRPAQMRASQIVLKTEAAAKKLLAELIAKKEDSKLFRDKAKELSIDEDTKTRGGDLGYFFNPESEKAAKEEHTVNKAIAKAAWAIEKVGEFAPAPVKTDAGFAIVKLTNKKPEMNRTFESVKRLIENRILRQLRRDKMDAFVDDLRKKAKIEIIDENLAKLEIITPETGLDKIKVPTKVPTAKKK